MMRRVDEDAVSEVIGVMLMISVTLIIVALVAVYATGAASGDEQPVRASLIASEVMHDENTDEYMVVFEHVAGDPLHLKQVQVSLGVRDDAMPHLVVNNDKKSYLQSFSNPGENSMVHLGDRFVLYADEWDADSLSWNGEGGGKFTVESGHFLTYRFIDRHTGAPISSGEIMVPHL
ncbi:FlaG/FlaF family flagellin (archaellin) [Methanofollis sp. W23]|uniref:type IV pilin n=1 Tax=Methanofollis sp. W23 TaxID=2817849 RepID=UPI001AE9DB3E|nr:type IV pilin N-terminal domain-containing protein [Methanofollis sp. W23]MBP2145325.1 FlaG/FlaF family flagellin (archaellin) [Methanofollis sp. W23]